MIEFTSLPQSWVVDELGSVCKLRNGYAFKSDKYVSEGVPVIRISDIGDGKVDLESCVKVEAERIYFDYKVKLGDILVAMSGATTGKFGIYKSNELAFQNQRVGKFEILHPMLLENNYLFYLLFALKRKILEDAYGGAQPNISSSKIQEMKVPLPPLAEQHRIVTKIEELFSELDKGIETLKTAQEQLKVYRQAVLKYAFEGRLTNPEVKEGELPDGWDIEQVGKLATVVRGGSPRPAGDKRFYDGSIPFLKVKDITRDDRKYVTYAEHSIKEAGLHKTRMVKSGTLLLSNSGATLGVPKITTFDTTMNDGVAAFLNLKCDANYMYYFWKSKTLILRSIDQGAAQPNLNTELIRDQIICLPRSREEQHKVVLEIESRLSVCDKIEESIEQGLIQAEALRQSILKRAFEGKLVPQDPNDEPATVLLERIKAERSKSLPEKKTKKKKVEV